MADNYLEKKFEAYRNASVRRKSAISLSTLLKKNRSYRGYDKSCKVTEAQLRRIAEVNTLIPSARNRQALRFKIVTADSGADIILGSIRLGGALPDLHLPLPGTEPEAFIIICSTIPEDKWIGVDTGISAQSMLLKATEMGLGGICIGAFDKEHIKEAFALPYEPVLILAIGKPAEKIELTHIHADEDHAYYRRDGIHYVPKLFIDDLLLK
ncbi:MAG: nitroreductase family protein [Bacteroidales bacterium]|nr:nitroreductase family protein [Candidatus Cacconaster merdequi]